jgi:hypothetical protein
MVETVQYSNLSVCLTRNDLKNPHNICIGCLGWNRVLLHEKSMMASSGRVQIEKGHVFKYCVRLAAGAGSHAWWRVPSLAFARVPIVSCGVLIKARTCVSWHFCTYGTPQLHKQYSVSLNFSSCRLVAVKFVYGDNASYQRHHRYVECRLSKSAALNHIFSFSWK